MSNQNTQGNKTEKLMQTMLKDDGPVALVLKQYLMPVGGHKSVIFPPTFAFPESEKKSKYNIDEFEDSHNVAIIDTVGSQANRMEPLFKRRNGKDTDYSRLVPQIEIKAEIKQKKDNEEDSKNKDRKYETIDLLDAGHRAADAIVRYSGLGDELTSAFKAYSETGDATLLAKISPTSLVFGAWDSRESQTKIPRLIASTILADDVLELKRSAQFSPPLDYVEEGVLEGDLLEQTIEKKKAGSVLGLKDAPATGAPGGVIVRGEIRREVILSLVGLRSIGPANDKEIRPYILGLCLVAMTYKQPHDLRQGCLLVRAKDMPDTWETVSCDGERKPVELDHEQVLGLAKSAADAFKVGNSRVGGDAVEFSPEKVKAAIEAAKKREKAKKSK